jgi:hypothetical protein
MSCVGPTKDNPADWITIGMKLGRSGIWSQYGKKSSDVKNVLVMGWGCRFVVDVMVVVVPVSGYRRLCRSLSRCFDSRCRFSVSPI